MQPFEGYNSSIEYLVKTNRRFEYCTYYNNFCQGFTRDQTKQKLMKDLKNSVFEFETNDNNVNNWIKEQLENDIPIANTIDVNIFWVELLEKRNFLSSCVNETERRTVYTDMLHQQIQHGTRSEIRRQTEFDYNVMEADSLIYFNGRSICSILKSEGKKLFDRYENLNDVTKALCAYCLSGILDLASESQRELFTNDQWSFVKRMFKTHKRKHLPHLTKAMKTTIAKMDKLINSGDYTASYYYLLSQIPAYSRNEQWIVKILSHVVNCYIERGQIFQASQKLSEYDYLGKLWCELFELMFGQADEYIKWGETVSNTTTTTKLRNNRNKSHTIGCKVDGRIVCQVDRPLDLCQIEASKVAAAQNKLFNDKIKLAIETKCILDDIVSRPSYSSTSHTHFIHNIQLSGVQSQVCTLTLVDAGLYVHVPDYELSLPNNIIGFSGIVDSWVRKLIAFKASCHRNHIVHTSATTPTKDILAETFGGHLEHQDNHILSNWVRGTFIMPTTCPPCFPENFLSSPSVVSIPLQNVKYKIFTLDDGTQVKQRVVKSKDSDKPKEKKRKLSTKKDKKGKGKAKIT